MQDEGRRSSSPAEAESRKTRSFRHRWIAKWSSRRAVLVAGALVLVIPGGAALASVMTGSSLGSPAKLASQEFHSILHPSSRSSAAASVYSTSTGTVSSVAATNTKKPLKCKKGQVKRTKKIRVKKGTKKVHGKTVTVFKTKKVTVCVPKKHVKAVHVRRPPSFTG